MANELEKSLATVAKGAGIVFIGMFIGNLLGIVNQMLLGRFLGVTTYGVFSLALSIIALLATFAVFGLFAALPRFIPFHLGKNERHIVKSSIDFSLLFVLCTSSILSIFFFLLTDRIALEIFQEPALILPLKIFFICLPILSLSNVFQGIIQAFKAVKFRLYIYDVGIRIVKMIIFIPLIIIGYRLFGAIAAYLAATLFTIVISIYVIQRKLFPDHNAYDRVPVAKQLLSFAWPLSLTGITFLFVSQTDVLLIGYYMTSNDVGIYVPALTIARFLTFVGSAFGYIFLPVVSGLFAKHKTTDIASLFKSTSKWMFVLVLPMFLFMILFPREILTLLYTADFAAGYIVLGILAFGIFSNVFTGMTGSILIGIGKTRLNLASEIIAAITNISLNFLLIPLYGIIGAAVATSLSYCMRNLASLLFVYHTNRMQPYTIKFGGIVLSGIVSLIIVLIIKIHFSIKIPLMAYLLAFGILLLVIYGVCLFIFRCLDEKDKYIMKLLFNQVTSQTSKK